jgi:hypothetical protein
MQVFELLSTLRPNLPDFNRTNWQSTLRRLVKTHPDYSTLEPWNGAETSDIFYSDESGVLTTLFIQKGYLDETWKGEKPEYFIEIKTTMSDNFKTPFYLSKYQYSRVRSHLPEAFNCCMLTIMQMQYISGGGTLLPHQEKKVYALFRVYGLESGRLGVKIYIDPENARKGGKLEFEADGWTVTPRTRTRTQQTQNGDGVGARGIAGSTRNFAIDLDFGGTTVPDFGGSSGT